MTFAWDFVLSHPDEPEIYLFLNVAFVAKKTGTDIPYFTSICFSCPETNLHLTPDICIDCFRVSLNHKALLVGEAGWSEGLNGLHLILLIMSTEMARTTIAAWFVAIFSEKMMSVGM